MVNKLTEAISRALDGAFGEGYTIYADDVEQGFNEPCFCIQPVNASRTQIVGRRYRAGNSFDILYFHSPSATLQADINSVHEVMFDKLEYVSNAEGGLYRGTHMSAETVDCIGHFLVDYNFIGIKPAKEVQLMETINIDTTSLKE